MINQCMHCWLFRGLHARLSALVAHPEIIVNLNTVILSVGNAHLFFPVYTNNPLTDVNGLILI